MSARKVRFVARECGEEYIIEDLDCNKYHTKRVTARTRVTTAHDHNERVFQLLAASANMVVDAAEMQQLDALALAESLDLSALICAAEEARRVLDADTNTVAGVADRETFMRQVLLNLQDALKTIPTRQTHPRKHVNELVQSRAQEH